MVLREDMDLIATGYGSVMDISLSNFRLFSSSNHNWLINIDLKRKLEVRVDLSMDISLALIWTWLVLSQKKPCRRRVLP